MLGIIFSAGRTNSISTGQFICTSVGKNHLRYPGFYDTLLLNSHLKTKVALGGLPDNSLDSREVSIDFAIQSVNCIDSSDIQSPFLPTLKCFTLYLNRHFLFKSTLNIRMERVQ